MVAGLCTVAGPSIARLCFLWRSNKNIADSAISPTRASPLITPPTISPTGVEGPAEAGVVAEPLATVMIEPPAAVMTEPPAAVMIVPPTSVLVEAAADTVTDIGYPDGYCVPVLIPLTPVYIGMSTGSARPE